VRIFSHARSSRDQAGPSAAGSGVAEIAHEVDGLVIRRITTRAEMEAALAVRYEVFCVEQGVPRTEERDGRDHGALHLIAVIGTCRLVFVGTTVQFSRLAVTKSARRMGVASELLKIADAETLAGGADRLVLHAQTYARSLYEQAGYIARGREFVEANIEHVAMEKTL
jgi:predicted GNAT family N-acyltransferase